METDEAIVEYDSVIHAVLGSYPDAIAEFEEHLGRRNYRGAYVLVEKTLRANGISFTREQDRKAERFFSLYVY